MKLREAFKLGDAETFLRKPVASLNNAVLGGNCDFLLALATFVSHCKNTTIHFPTVVSAKLELILLLRGFILIFFNGGKCNDT